MSSEKEFIFDESLNPLKQTIIANHLISEIKNQGKKNFEICPYSLSEKLSVLNARFSRTVLDIILEYDLVNPQAIKTMGNGIISPYSGIYNQKDQNIKFELSNFPPTLIVILQHFCYLLNKETQYSNIIKERILHNNSSFVLQDINLEDSFKRITPLDNIINNSGKVSHDIVIPGKSVLVNNCGGTTRLLSCGEYLNLNESPYHKETGKPCWWCRHPFDAKAVGIPVKVSRNEDKLNVYMDGIFCSFECAYSYLRKELNISFAYRNPIYANSKELIKQMYDEHFPGKELTCAPDWIVLRDVGNGDVSIKDFNQKLSSYRMGVHPNYDVSSVIRRFDLMKK